MTERVAIFSKKMHPLLFLFWQSLSFLGDLAFPVAGILRMEESRRKGFKLGFCCWKKTPGMTFISGKIFHCETPNGGSPSVKRSRTGGARKKK